MKKYTHKGGFKFRFPWRRNTFKRDLGYVKPQEKEYKMPLLDQIFLNLCNKKKEEVKLNSTKRKGLLYQVCKKIYKNKFMNQIELKTMKKTNENKRADELLAQYYRNLGQNPPTPKPIYNRKIKKSVSPQYNGL